MLKRAGLTLIFLQGLFFVSAPAVAWSGRGHDVICRSTVFLLKNKNLQNFLKYRLHTMGHLCNLPDTYWKSLSKDQRRRGDPAHYIDPEVLGLTPAQVPLDLQEIHQKYAGTQNLFDKEKKIFDVTENLGTAWWRVDQFYRRTTGLSNIVKEMKSPLNSMEEQSSDLSYNKTIYQMYTEMGLMGHFVSDLGQPFHNTSDHDGYEAGHGGIHAYYEDHIVAQFDSQFDEKVLAAAKKIKKLNFMKSTSVIERMRGLSSLSVAGVQEIYKLDPILKKSMVEKTSEGMRKKTPAERRAPKDVYLKFEKQIIKDLSRSVFVLAALWDEMYEKMGQPDLTAYRSYRYPFTVEFVPLDYIPTNATEQGVAQ